MPRYGDPDYDPDFDDSPPPTPKYRPPPPSRWKSWYWTLRRNRSLLIFSFFFFYTLHFLRTWRAPIFTPKHAPALRYKNVDWRLYAYSQYATDSHYLCNALMVFDQLERLGSRAQRVLMYPRQMDTVVSNPLDRDSQLLVKARDEYGVQLVPMELEGMRSDNWNDPSVKNDLELNLVESWDVSISKFLVFNQTQYLRIVHLDSDVTVLKNMDDLFLLPSARAAMPRAYWQLDTGHRALSSQFILLEPNARVAEQLQDEAEAETRGNIEFDTVILNRVFGDSALVLPHRVYALQSAEFRRSNHTAYHGNSWEIWHPERAMSEASLVHFSDRPLPKPWIMWPSGQRDQLQPKCDDNLGALACRNQEIWLELYHSFRDRRKKVCGLLSVPAPDWPPPSELPLKDSGE